jgi:hypothetical protein
MCNIILINGGEKQIQTPIEFLEHFGFMPEIFKEYANIDMNSCLCQVDIETSFIENNIFFKKECGVFYVITEVEYYLLKVLETAKKERRYESGTDKIGFIYISQLEEIINDLCI